MNNPTISSAGPKGSGRTTAQLVRLPRGSMFFWCTSDIWYPRSLCHKLNRADIKVFPRSHLDDYYRFHGCRFPGADVDHAVLFSADEADCWEKIISLVVRRF